MALEDQEPLELIHLYADQTEEVVWARRVEWANEGLTPDDVDQWTDTREGSYFQFVSVLGAREDARIYDLMGTEVVAAAHPLFAWGTYLDSHSEVQRLFRNPAVAATGEVTFTGVNGTVIGSGAEVGVEPTDPDAEAPEFETTETVTIAGGTATAAIRASTGGEAGNVSAGAVVADLSGIPGVTSLTNAERTVGGADTETDEQLLERLLAVFGGGGGWNVAAFKVAALAYGNGIGRVTVLSLWNGPGTVKIIVATAAGDPVSAGTVSGLQAFLDPIVQRGAGEVMVGLAVTVETVAILDVTVVATVEFEPGYSLDGDAGTVATRPLIELRLREYAEAVESGGEIVHQQIVGCFTSVKGVHDVGGPGAGDEPTVNGSAGNVPVDDDPPQVPSVGTITLTEGNV